MIEAPLELQKIITIPKDHEAVCRAGGVPTAGNAAGNTVDLLDLKGENASPAPLPAGFTAGGIVALVFSCISAVLGLAVIAWYVHVPFSGLASRVSGWPHEASVPRLTCRVGRAC